MGLQTYQPIALVSNSGRGIRVDTFNTYIDVVKQLTDNGCLGFTHGQDMASCYGSPEHIEAIQEIEEHLKAVKQRIEISNQPKSDSGIESED